MASFHENAVKFGGEANAEALDKLYAIASEEEKQRLARSAEDWARHASNPDEHVRTRSRGGMADSILAIAEAHKENTQAKDALATLTGDPAAGQKLEQHSHDKERLHDISSELRTLRGSNQIAIAQLNKEKQEIDSRFDALRASLSQHLDEASHTPQPAAKAAATPAQPAPAAAEPTEQSSVPATAKAAEIPLYKGKDYITRVPVPEGHHPIQGDDFQMALKQLAEEKKVAIDLGKTGTSHDGVDGQVGGKSLRAFNQLFHSDGKDVAADPASLKLTEQQMDEIRVAAVRYKKAHPEKAANVEARPHHGHAHHHDKPQPKSHDEHHTTGERGSHPEPRKKDTSLPKVMPYNISEELRPINPELIKQMVMTGGETDKNKTLDMKWFNERAKFIGDNYAQTEAGQAYAKTHGGAQKDWREAMAEMMHFAKVEPIVTSQSGVREPATAVAPLPHRDIAKALGGENGLRELAATLSRNNHMKDGTTPLKDVTAAIETSLGNTRGVVKDGKLSDAEMVAALKEYAKDKGISVMNAESAILTAANDGQYLPAKGGVASAKGAGPSRA